jgi:hypothetical protein
MPGFGPFDKFSDALIAACPVILSKPRAAAGRPTDENFRLRWMISQEYCAWLYYTPDHKYEMSLLVAGMIQDDPRKRTCRLPSVVIDDRYPPESLGYVFVLHNHPYENILSDFDIHFIVEMATEHGAIIEKPHRPRPHANSSRRIPRIGDKCYIRRDACQRRINYCRDTLSS